MKNYYNIIKNKTNIKPKFILEIGSRDADDANTLRELSSLDYENVYVVEPNPNQHPLILNKYPKINLIKEAIFNKESTFTFNSVLDNGYVGVSSLLERKDNFYSSVETKKITINTITGQKLLDIINNDIDFCKIDVEGATYEVLESFDTSIKKIKSFHIECEHQEVWLGQKLYNDVKLFLENNNFVQIYFEFVNNVELQSDSIWVNKKYLNE